MPAVTTGDGGSIAYAKIGSGKRPVLLIGDWLLSGFYWQEVMDLLPQDTFTIFMPDLRGTGLSFQPEAGGYTLDRFAEDMIGLISNETSFEAKWIVVGHGFGSLVAQRLAALYGRKIGGLVLVAPSPMSGAMIPSDLKAAYDAAAVDAEKFSELYPKLFATQPDEDIAEELMDEATGCSSVYAAEALAAWQTGGPTDRLAKIKARTLVIAGGKDPVISESAAKTEVAEKLKDATVKAYSDAGHMIPLEKPRELASDIAAFAGQIEGA